MPSKPMPQAWRKIAPPSPVIASLSWMPCRIALLLRESSRAEALPALFQGLRAHVLPVQACYDPPLDVGPAGRLSIQRALIDEAASDYGNRNGRSLPK